MEKTTQNKKIIKGISKNVANMKLMDFAHANRSELPEKMDDPKAPANQVYTALAELELINKYLGGYKVITEGLDQIIQERESLRIMDVGCGGGDSLRKIAQWALNKKVAAELIGVDINPLMINYSIKNSLGFSNIRFLRGNIWDPALDQIKPDVVISSLFCHHFNDDQIVDLLKRLCGLSGKYVLINDLHRHWMAYYSIKTLTSVFSETELVKYDAPLSVNRSFTRKDLEKFLKLAGVENYSIKWMWAWRWQIIISK